MKLKRAYLVRTLQIGDYTMRSLGGAEAKDGTWNLNLHPHLGALSIALNADVLYVPLTHVETFELVDAEEEAKVSGRPRTKRPVADL